MLDVAAKAGVSRASVSIVFRGASGVGEGTRLRVLAAADELGYVRDESARGLRSDRPTNIGVCFQTRQPFQLELVDGLYAAIAGSSNQLLLSASSDSRSESEAIESLLGYRSGVLILISPSMSERELVSLAAKVPVISVGRQIRAPQITWVASDDQAGMSTTMSHLKDLGHSDILYLSSLSAPAGSDRLRALKRAAEAQGMLDSLTIGEGGMTENEGVLAAEELLRAEKLPTAIIGFNDRCALGVLEVFLRRGVDVPADVSVIGFDDSEIASRRPNSMTSVHQDPLQMASLAIDRALQLLSPSGGDAMPRGTLVPTSLTIRSTSGQARG